MQAGRIDQQAATQVHRLGSADLDLDAAIHDAAALHRTVEGEHGAVAFGIALQRQHVGMAVDDAGAGREQRGRAVQIGLHRHRFGGAQEAHALDAVGLGATLDLRKLVALDLVGRDDQLAAVEMRHAVLLAIGIEHAPAGDAGARHQAALGVVDAGVDDLGIARARFGADGFGGLHDNDLTAGEGKRPGDGKAYNTCANDNAVDGFERGRIHGRMLEPRPLSVTKGGCRSMKGALVTGAGVRIGRALAMALAADGFFVFVHHRNSAAGARETVATIRKAGGKAIAVRADLASARQAEALVGKCRARGVRLTCLVNNASLFKLDQAPTATAADFDLHMAINLRAPLLLAQALARQLPAGETGLVVNVLDQKLFSLNPDFLTYTLSKVGLQGLTTLLAQSFAPRLRVAGIAPGLTLRSGSQTVARFAEQHADNPLGVGVQIEDLVRALRFIVATPSYTGDTLVVDGGEHLIGRPRDIAFDEKKKK